MFGWRKVVKWLEERLYWTEMVTFLQTFGFPSRSPTRVIGGFHILGFLTWMLFLFQIITGLLLAFYYHPTPKAAYATTLLIIRDTHFGWYMHQMHYWGSHLLIGLLGLRLVGLLVQGAYKNRGEIAWISGVVLFSLALHGAITGNLLPWDQQAYWATVRVLEIIEAIPLWRWVLSFLVGGFSITPALLIRFYIIHIIFIPFLMVVFFYAHFATVRRIGWGSSSEHLHRIPGVFFEPVVLGLLLFGVVLTLGTLFPCPFIGEDRSR